MMRQSSCGTVVLTQAKPPN